MSNATRTGRAPAGATRGANGFQTRLKTGGWSALTATRIAAAMSASRSAGGSPACGEVVEDDSVVERVDVGGEDLQPLRRQGAGDAVEDAGGDLFPRPHAHHHRPGLRLPAGRGEDAVHRQPGEPAEFLDDPGDGRVAQHRRRQPPGDPDDGIVRIAVGEQGCQFPPAVVGGQRRRLAVEVAEGPIVQVAEQVGLPLRPRARPDGGDVGRRQQ